MPSHPSETFSVYVIELDEAVCERTDCASRRSGKPHVYVGETKHTPEERFEVHRAGGFTARPVVTNTAFASVHGFTGTGGRTRPGMHRAMPKRG